MTLSYPCRQLHGVSACPAGIGRYRARCSAAHARAPDTLAAPHCSVSWCPFHASQLSLDTRPNLPITSIDKIAMRIFDTTELVRLAIFCNYD